MLRGRHRILPMAIDRAVLLPGEGLMEKLDKEENGRGGFIREERESLKRRVRAQEQGGQAERDDVSQEQDPED